MIRGATIICISSIDWTFNWQQPQEVASAFAAGDNRVLFIENTGVRRPRLRDAARLLARLRNWSRAAGGAKPLIKGLDVLSPLLLPFPYSRVAGRLNASVLLRKVRRWIGARDGHPLIVYTFLPTPLAHAIIRDLDPSLVVYYCIDRLSESSPQARQLRGPEEKLIAEAGLVLTSSEELYAAAAKLTPRVERLPCGVRCREFEDATTFEPPSLFARLAGLVVGFVGTLRNEIDLALLAAAAELAPDLNFVFVGPVMANVRRLAAQPNVRLVGPVPHPEVARYMAGFDVGVLPYVLNQYTAAIMPAKLKEYLAAGLPVVATPLPEVRRFADEHPEVIAFADDAPDFVAALRAAAAKNGPAAAVRRRRVARRYDWSAQMARMNELMERALAAKR
ncbi:MAG TPA: glycosyltransferase [Thermoanaerobaculia bacterium]|nr:glycosyltransferase [Thermoanaerobaculia bacterium]